MAKKKTARAAPPEGFVSTHQAIARIFGVTTEAVDRWPREKMPKKTRRGYDLAAIFAWWLKRPGNKSGDGKVEEGVEARIKAATADLREHKAKLAAIELEREENRLIPREELRLGLMRIAGILREFGVRLQQFHGREAHLLFDEYLDDAEREILKLVTHEDDDGGGTEMVAEAEPSAPPPDDA